MERIGQRGFRPKGDLREILSQKSFILFSNIPKKVVHEFVTFNACYQHLRVSGTLRITSGYFLRSFKFGAIISNTAPIT